MASETKEDPPTEEMTIGNEDEIEEVEILDEYKVAFDAVVDDEEKVGSSVISRFQELLQNDRIDDVAVKIKEQCMYKLARLFTIAREFESILLLLKTNDSLFSAIPKAKTAKIVRTVLEVVAAQNIPDSLDIQVRLCKDVVEWCKIEKRTFLKQRIEGKLAYLLLQSKEPQQGLQLITTLLGELRKLDDKQMLTEAHLTESRIYHALKNIPKAKASLTASRTAAHAIYVNPVLQSELDEMSGILHCEEGDNATAFSYFLEAFEGYDQSKDARAVVVFKYMILCKVLADAADEVPSLLCSKIGLKHTGGHIDAMSSIARAAKERSLETFKHVVSQYSEFLLSDHLICHHLDKLYDNMLESNLLKIIHPYSCVEIDFVAKKINLPLEQVERKLSQMILDHSFSGILDQGKGQLIVYQEGHEDSNYSRGVEIITNMGAVTDALFSRAKTLGKVSS